MKRTLVGVGLCSLIAGTLAAPFDITPRQVVEMPAEVVVALRGEMVDLLTTLQRAQALSADGKHHEAADLVDRTMGIAAMGSHGAGVRPGAFMPPAMRSLAQGLHRSSSDWAAALRTGDRRRAEDALGTVLGTCTGCHTSFQLRRQP